MPGIDSYAKLMLHCNGSDASTTFTDDSDTPKTVTPNGDAQIDTAQSVFGGASALFDGNGDYLSIPDDDDWNFGNGDFTVDFRVRFNALGGVYRGIFDQYYTSRSWTISLNNSNHLYFGYSTNGSNYNDNDFGWTPSTGTWYHIAIVRNGTDLMLFVDGVQQGSTVNIGTTTFSNSTVPLYIGCQHTGDNTPGNYFDGWLDEIRISKGLARWITTFTPPALEYSSSLETLDMPETVTLSEDWLLQVNPEQETFGESISLSEGWFVEDNPKFETFSETLNISDNFGIQQIIRKLLNTKFNWKLLFTSGIHTAFNWLLANSINTSFTWLGQSQSIINTDFRWLTNPYSILNPITSLDAEIIINGYDVLLVNDLDIQSGNITHTIGQKSVANFTLARKHDDLDRTHLGVSSQITNQNPIQIYISGHLEFDGYISNIAANSENETIQVTALMDEPADNRHTISLPLPSVNEPIHIYHCLVNSYQIDNPKEDTRAVITGSNGKYWTGSSWVYRIEDAQIFTTDNDAQIYLTNLLEDEDTSYQSNPNFIRIFTNNSPSVTSREKNVQYYKGIKVNLGKKIQQQVDSWIDFDNIFATYSLTVDGVVHDFVDTGVNAAKMSLGVYPIKQNYSYFWSVLAKNIRTGQENFDYRYIGTSMGSLATDLWVLRGASPTRQRIKENIETELGYYYVGTAPYKEVSTKNGQLIVVEKYQDRDDGLYHISDASYNYVNFAKLVAGLEYQKLLNINGNISPITSANIEVTFDAYYYYTIKLLTRINVTNTTVANTFNNTNGFPTSVKGISINFSTMKVSLNTDNRLSQEEIDELDSQMPDEFNTIYSVPEKAVLVYRKFDLKTWQWVT